MPGGRPQDAGPAVAQLAASHLHRSQRAIARSPEAADVGAAGDDLRVATEEAFGGKGPAALGGFPEPFQAPLARRGSEGREHLLFEDHLEEPGEVGLEPLQTASAGLGDAPQGFTTW